MLTTNEKQDMPRDPASGQGRAGGGSARIGCFDPSVLESLGVQDPELVEEVLITFLVASTDLLRDMFHRQRLGDVPGLASGASRLREMAEAVGAPRLAERCRVLESLEGRAGHSDPEAEIQELFALDRELDRSQGAIRTYLQGWVLD